MTYTLPVLKQTPSPNFSERSPNRIDLIVVHCCEGNYEGSINWFCTPKSQVSAHLVLNDDGTECTQLVPFDRKAWHCCSYNSRSIGLEMSGFAKVGFAPSELNADAAIVAWLLRKNSIPCRWAVHGDGPGFCSHYDLGAAGGNHSDPTTDQQVWLGFVLRIQQAYAQFLADGLPDWPVAPDAPHAVPAAPADFIPSNDVRRDDPVISPWPAFDPNMQFFKNAALAIKTFRSSGLRDEQAFGLTAQIEGECSLNQKIWTAVNREANGAQAGGIGMFHNDRRNAMLAGTGIDVWTEPDLVKQIIAMLWELRGPEKQALAKIMAAMTTYDAGVAACQSYERAGANQAMQRRGLMAMRLETFSQLHPEMLT